MFHLSEVTDNKHAVLKSIKGASGTITLKPGATAIELAARELLPNEIRVKSKLKRIESDGIIEKVESSQWASPIVCAMKPENTSEFVMTAVDKLIQNQTNTFSHLLKQHLKKWRIKGFLHIGFIG